MPTCGRVSVYEISCTCLRDPTLPAYKLLLYLHSKVVLYLPMACYCVCLCTCFTTSSTDPGTNAYGTCYDSSGTDACMVLPEASFTLWSEAVEEYGTAAAEREIKWGRCEIKAVCTRNVCNAFDSAAVIEYCNRACGVLVLRWGVWNTDSVVLQDCVWDSS
eukprot:888866-Rhodomonas_salina.6